MVWILIVIYILIIVMEVPSLVKGRMYPELGAFFVVLAIGVYMTLAFYFQWPLIGPFNALMHYMES